MGLGAPVWLAEAGAILASGVFAGSAYQDFGIGTFSEGFQIGLAAGTIGVGIAHAAGGFDASIIGINGNTQGTLYASGSSVSPPIEPSRINFLTRTGSFLQRAGLTTGVVGAGVLVASIFVPGLAPLGLGLIGVGVGAYFLGSGIHLLEPRIYGPGGFLGAY